MTTRFSREDSGGALNLTSSSGSITGRYTSLVRGIGSYGLSGGISIVSGAGSLKNQDPFQVQTLMLVTVVWVNHWN